MPLLRLPTMQSKIVHTSTLNMEELVGTVKTLFFRRHYKRCANHCVRYLSDHEDELHPVYKIFVLYFAGISNDCYARGMYSRSPLVPSTLDEAEAFFTQAQALLCEARIVTPHSFLPQSHYDHFEDSDDGSSYKSMHIHRSEHSEDSMSRPSTAATSISAYSTDTDILFYDWAEEMSTKPHVSPLNVHKYQALPETPSKLPLMESTALFSQLATSPEATTSRPNPRLASFYLLRFPPSEPPPPPEPLLTPRPISQQEEIPYPDKDDCFHEPDHVEIYNSQLASFSNMLHNHIISIRRFREQSQAIASSIFVAASRDGTGKRKMSPEERMERMIVGRERKWARPRFDPTRYRDLCELAIAEL